MTIEMAGLIMDMQKAITAYFPETLLRQFVQTIEAAGQRMSW